MKQSVSQGERERAYKEVRDRAQAPCFTIIRPFEKGWRTRRLIRNKGESTAAYFKDT